MSGMWKRSTAEMLGHSQTKERATGNPNLGLNRRATSRLYQEIYTLLHRDGSLRTHIDRLMPFDDFNQLVDLERHYRLDERYKT
jgi:hypothetical protein